MKPSLHLLSAGAAKGLVTALQPAFETLAGCSLKARFGAVGAMRQALLDGEPCDLMVLTDALIDALVADGRLVGRTRVTIGRVRTGLAVRAGQALPDLSTPQALRDALAAAAAIFYPDPARATAGIHFQRVLVALGLAGPLAPRLRTYPNGAAAMAELAACPEPGAIGCTQLTEILYTPGVQPAGALPPPFELDTAYGAAVVSGAREPMLAQRLQAELTSERHAALRAAGGFEG